MTDDLRLRPPPPLATGARSGRLGDGPCALCQRQIGYGVRIATLEDGRLVHTRCLATAVEDGVL